MVLGAPWAQRLIHIFEKHTAFIFSWSSPEEHLDPKEPSCAIANGPGFSLGSSWVRLGRSWVLFGELLGVLGSSWELLGSPWEFLGAS